MIINSGPMTVALAASVLGFFNVHKKGCYFEHSLSDSHGHGDSCQEQKTVDVSVQILSQRPLQEIDSFWSLVRKCLDITDAELYG